MNISSRSIERIALYTLFGLIVFFQLVRFASLPQFIDDFFHLHAAGNFLKIGGWSAISFWDYAPAGRVNLYPPFYHMFLALFLSLGIEKIILLQLSATAIALVFFFSLFFATKQIFGRKVAFFSLLSTFSSFSFYTSLCANIPATLGLIFILQTVAAIHRKHQKTAFIFCLLTLYTHAGLSYAFLSSLIGYAFFSKEYKILRTAFLAILGASPLMIHQLRHLHYFHPVYLSENAEFSINILHVGIALFGSFCIFSRNTKNQWPIFFTLALFCIFIRYPFRFFSGQGLLGIILISSITIVQILSRLPRKPLQNVAYSVLTLSIFFGSSTITPYDQKKFTLYASTFSRITANSFQNSIHFNSLYFPKTYSRIRTIIEQNTDTKDIIASNNAIIAIILGSLCNRATTTSVFPEIKPFLPEKNSYQAARLLIWIKNPSDNATETQKRLYQEKNLHLQKIAEDDFSYIYYNPNYQKAKIPKPQISFFTLFGISFCLGCLMIYLRRRN